MTNSDAADRSRGRPDDTLESAEEASRRDERSRERRSSVDALGPLRSPDLGLTEDAKAMGIVQNQGPPADSTTYADERNHIPPSSIQNGSKRKV